MDIDTVNNADEGQQQHSAVIRLWPTNKPAAASVRAAHCYNSRRELLELERRGEI